MTVLTAPPLPAETVVPTGRRAARPRRYVMSPPEHFDVVYAINPWMDPAQTIDRALASAQWEALRATYERLGHRVEVLPAAAGLPDMVFAANGAVVHRGRALGSRYAYPQRQAEAALHATWLRAAGFEPVPAEHVVEGEGDLLVAGDRVLAGYGFRTDRRAHEQAARVLQTEVVSLELVDPLYYHLDTCLAVLADDDVAWLPSAFSAASQDVVRRLYPDALEVDERDAAVLGLNAVSDGLYVVTSAEATSLHRQLADRGYRPVPVEVSELRKAGGGVKCCTLELRD